VHVGCSTTGTDTIGTASEKSGCGIGVPARGAAAPTCTLPSAPMVITCA
jgi:hypothetical protein